MVGDHVGTCAPIISLFTFHPSLFLSSGVCVAADYIGVLFAQRLSLATKHEGTEAEAEQGGGGGLGHVRYVQGDVDDTVAGPEVGHAEGGLINTPNQLFSSLGIEAEGRQNSSTKAEVEGCLAAATGVRGPSKPLFQSSRFQYWPLAPS